MRKHAVLAAMTLMIWAVGCGVKPEPAATPSPDNAELESIVAAEQADREPDLADIDWPQMAARDAARRLVVRRLIADDQLRTARDFERAALVFQHGDAPDDILFAHVLAVTALGLNNASLGAKRLAAMTLDRYLMGSGQAQVFGTQFNTTDVGDPTKWTMEPYNESLVVDSLRRLNCVESRAESQLILEQLQSGTMSATPPPVCLPTGPTATQ